MTMSVDASSSSGPFTASGQSFAVAGGTPKGILVGVLHGSNTPETISVTYNGVNIPAISGSPFTSVVWAAVGGVTLHLFFKGDGVASGTNNVIITKSGTNNSSAHAITLNASAGNLLVNTTEGGAIDSASITNPSDTLLLGAIQSLVLMLFGSGESDPASITPNAGWTDRGEVDLGSIQSGLYSYDTIGASDVVYGWQQTSDDAFAVALSIKEVSALTPPYTLATVTG